MKRSAAWRRRSTNGARHANDQRQHRQYPEYRDRAFLRDVSAFASRARQFDARMADFRGRPYRLDDDLRILLSGARALESRVERTARRSGHLVADWNGTVDLLNEMVGLYRADVERRAGDRGPGGRGRGPGSDGRDTRDKGDPRDAPREGRDPRDGRDGQGGYDPVAPSGGFRDLARELADRTARISESAKQLSGPIPADARQRSTWQAMAHLADQARALSQKTEQGLDRRQFRANLEPVLQATRETEDQLKQSNVFPELRRDWAAVRQTLERLKASPAP
ncbi:MAG: hypothetical protein ABR610_12485 [Thermoanaerobaculia bacterium]